MPRVTFDKNFKAGKGQVKRLQQVVEMMTKYSQIHADDDDSFSLNDLDTMDCLDPMDYDSDNHEAFEEDIRNGSVISNRYGREAEIICETKPPPATFGDGVGDWVLNIKTEPVSIIRDETCITNKPLIESEFIRKIKPLDPPIPITSSLSAHSKPRIQDLPQIEADFFEKTLITTKTKLIETTERKLFSCRRMDVPPPEDYAARLTTLKGVLGVIVANKDGTSVFSSMDNTSTVNYIASFGILEQLATSTIREVDPSDEIISVRIRSKRLEVLVKPDPNYAIYVIQKVLPRENIMGWGTNRGAP